MLMQMTKVISSLGWNLLFFSLQEKKQVTEFKEKALKCAK